MEKSPAGESPDSTPVPSPETPLSDLWARLDASEEGLTDEDATKRLTEYGPNELPEKEENLVTKFLSYFWGPIPVMIEVAAILSATLRHWPDLAVILALLLLNAVVGFREEFQAASSIAALKAQLAPNARAKRNGKWRSIPARELVPGDVVRLRIGDVVPADARLFEGTAQVDQSALTGESLPVDKKSGDVLYSGSILKQGEVDSLVYATGRATYFGKTAQLVEEAETRSHFQQAVVRIANYLIAVALTLAVLILGVSAVRGNPLLEMIQLALVLTIASVPVAMPAVMSVTMALGARRLARQEAVVTHLPAIEELAGIDVLCSDKTGTLTQNRLTAGDPAAVDGPAREDILLAAALASREEDQDPIDMAVLRGADGVVAPGFHVTEFQPFDPVRKRTQATVEAADGTRFRVTKGAPQVILALDPQAPRLEEKVTAVVGEFAGRGFRSLGVARADDESEWRFLGVIPLYDPIREDSKETVEAAEAMGIEIKMVTGDQVAIAKEVARELGLGENVLDAKVFDTDIRDSPERLAALVAASDGFAQVFPDHKYRIVEALQAKRHIVGMTGDGVNDAPALKKADAGIAVSGATDAARAAADIVLLRPGLATIVDAIKESRRIFQRMTNYAIYRIAETFALLVFLGLSILIFNSRPVTATMIVLLAMLNDGAILSIAYDRARYSNRPEAWDMRVVLGMATALGLFAAGRSFGAFLLAERVVGLDSEVAQTFVYLNLSVGGHLTLFAARTRGPFWSTRPASVLVAAVMGTQVLATIIAVSGFLMKPLDWRWAALVWGYDLALFLPQDFVKTAVHGLLRRGRERKTAAAPAG
ncbi:MAG: plasma-membrane proton-efflux P-type ATPase [Dehalococcoidia bacterium]|nr:plasma-membrane proton-efflux P-type ATPase [Dehalococcoidia bacterium]